MNVRAAVQARFESTSPDRIEWLLRIGLAACFIGHGAFGILRKPAWVAYFAWFGIDGEWALRLMPIVGSIDITIGLLALLWPARAVFLYAAVWAFLTALLRPLSGEGIPEALERAGNYGVPIALLALTGLGGWRDWLRRASPQATPTQNLVLVSRVCRLATCALLAGHGLLALGGKPLLQEHFALLGVPAFGVQLAGAGELALALACLALPNRGLLLGIATWKIGSESLFLLSGAPIWEFIERGGSYIAPLAAGLLVVHDPEWAALQVAPLVRTARTVAVMIALALVPGAVSAQTPGLPRATEETMTQLRAGALVVACRHAITDHAREDRHPVDFDRAETQRVLSEAGERQASELGAIIKRLGLPFQDVRSSPYQRTRRSAELMFGQVTIDSILSSTNRGKREQLARLLSEPPAAQANRALMTHQGVLYPLFPMMKQGSIAEGDCIAVRPDGTTYNAIAHIKPEDWR